MRLARSNWARTVIVVALLAGMFWFASTQLTAGVSNIGAAALRDNLPLLAVATATFMCATLLLGGAWITLIESVSAGEPTRRRKLLVAFSYSWLGRYLPGTLPFFAGKVYLGTRVGYGTRPLLVSTAVQNVLEILIATIVGATAIAASQGATTGDGRYIALALFPMLGLITVHPHVLRRLIDASLHVLHREPIAEGSLPPTRALATASLFIAGNQMLNGLALLVILHSVAGAGWDDALLAIGALSLAGVTGILVILLPAGLGVRDGVLAALLTSRFTVETAALAAIVMRLVTVFADLALFATALCVDLAAGWRLAWRAVRVEREPVSPTPVPTPAVAAERRAA